MRIRSSVLRKTAVETTAVIHVSISLVQNESMKNSSEVYPSKMYANIYSFHKACFSTYRIERLQRPGILFLKSIRIFQIPDFI